MDRQQDRTAPRSRTHGFQSLRFRLMSAFLVVSLIPLLLSSLIAGNRTLTHLAAQKNLGLVRQTERARDVMSLRMKAAADQLGLLGAQADLYVVLEMANQGKTALDASRIKSIETTLKNAVKQSGGLYETVMLSRADGGMVADGSRKTAAYPGLNGADAITRMKASKEILSGPVAISTASGRPVLPVTLPLWSVTGYQGSLTVLFDLEAFTAPLLEMMEEGGNRILVADASGRCLFGGSGDALLKPVPWNPEDLSGAVPAADQVKTATPTLLRTSDGLHAVAALGMAATGWTITVDMPQREFTAEARSYGTFLLSLSLLLAVAVFLFADRFAGTVIHPIRKLNDAFQAAGNGNLTHRVQYRAATELESIRDGFHGMTDKLSALVHRVQGAGSTLSDASEQLSGMVSQVRAAMAQCLACLGELSGGADSQAADTLHVSKRMQAMSERIGEINASLDHIGASIGEIRTDMHKGESQMDRLRDESLHNLDSSGAARTAMSALHAEVGRMRQITRTLSGIASNTNLLALNASIEAARAGDHGLGFAVVAAEIRELSDRSAAESREIDSLIGNIQRYAADTAERIAQVESLAAGHHELSETSRNAFLGIVRQVDSISTSLGRMVSSVSAMDAYKNEVSLDAAHISQTAASIADEARELHTRFDALDGSMAQAADCSAALDTLATVLLEDVRRLSPHRDEGTAEESPAPFLLGNEVTV